MKAHQQDVQRCLYNIDYRRTVFVESIKPVYIYKYIQILQSSSVQVQGHAAIGTNWIGFYSFGIHWINEKGVPLDRIHWILSVEKSMHTQRFQK